MDPETEQGGVTRNASDSAWKASAPHGELVFRNVAQLKNAMKAARTILRTHDPSAATDAACRFISRKGEHTAQVLATDGHRLCRIDVAPIRESATSEEFDVAMPLDAVRAIANARRTALILIGRKDDACVVALGHEDMPGTTYAACKTYSIRTYERIIEEEPAYAAVAEMKRSDALNTLRTTTPSEDEYNPDGICRFEIAEDGLRMWPTRCEPAPACSGPGRKLADDVRCLEKPIVFGMRHSHMVETLRTMTGRGMWMLINNAAKPIHIGAAGGGQRYVITPFALSETQPG